MNNKVLWIVGAIIVIALAAYLVMAKSKSGNEAVVNNAQTNTAVKNAQNAASPATNAQAPKQSSLKELLALGTAQKCTFNDNGSQGTFYVASGKSRGDFSSTVSGKTTSGHMIADGKTSYVWMDGQAQGFKMTIDATSEQQANNAASAAPSQGVDANKKMDYNCTAWTEDSAMFSLPTNVQFLDIANMMKK